MVMLAKFETTTRSNEGVEMQLRDLKTGQPSGAWIRLLGKDSEEFRRIKEERSRMFADRVASGKSADLTQEEQDDLTCDMLARCTKGWSGLDVSEGEPLVFSQAAAKSLYRSYPAIREQVNVFIAERANFVLA